MEDTEGSFRPGSDTLEHMGGAFSVSGEDWISCIQGAVDESQPTQSEVVPRVKDEVTDIKAILDAFRSGLPREMQIRALELLVREHLANVELVSKYRFETMTKNILETACSAATLDAWKPMLQEVMMYQSGFEIDVFDKEMDFGSGAIGEVDLSQEEKKALAEFGRYEGVAARSIRVPEDMSDFCQLLHHLTVPTQLSVHTDQALYAGTIVFATWNIGRLKELFGNLRSLTTLLVVTSEEEKTANSFQSGTWWHDRPVTVPHSFWSTNSLQRPALPGNAESIVGDLIGAVEVNSPARENYFKLIMRRGMRVFSDHAYWELHCNPVKIDGSQTASEIIEAAMATAYTPDPEKFRNRS